MKKNKDVEVIVDKCIKNKIILGKELIDLHYNYYFVQIAEAFEKYSDEVIKSYLINCIQQGKDKKELKFPRDNRAESIVIYIFGKNFRQEMYRKDYVLAICCQKVFKKFIRENSWEVLFAKKLLDISNCGYDNITLSVETLSYIDDCFEKKRPLGNIYDTYNIKKKSSRYNFLNNSIIPLKTYDQWIEYISGYIKKRAEEGKVFNGDRTIVEELFGEEIYSNYMRLNVSCKADFHTIIEQSKKEITEKFYFFPEKIHEEAINNIKNRRALLSIIAEIPKYSPAVNYIFYVEKYIIPKVGEEEFKLYLDDMIEKELIKGNNKILEVSYNILGFPANSFNHIGRHKKLEQLFYFRWMHHVPMHYNGDSSIEKMLKKSGFSEDQKKDWFISRYGTRAKFMDATWKEVEIICNQIIMDFLNEGKILNRGYFYARLLQINDKDILANYNLSKINHYDKIEKLLAFNIRCYEERLKQRNKVLISKRMNEIRIYYKKHNSYNSCCLKFYKIQSDQIREILMDYLEKNYIEYDDNSIMNLTADLRRTIEIIQVIQNKFKIELISDITTHMIAFSFHYMEFEQGLKPITIKGKHTAIKKIFRYCYEHEVINENPCKKLEFHNTLEHTKNTSYIPEEVLCVLDNKIGELPVKYSLIYRMLSETATRFSEIADMRVTDIAESDKEGGYIQIVPYKVLKRRQERGFDETITKYLSKQLYEDLKSYIADTDNERQEANIDAIFFCKTRGRYSSMAPKSFNDEVNKLIQKYDIRTENGELWHFHSKQNRKTAAVIMINNGADIEDVQFFLGHMNRMTTASYYAEVKYLTIQKMNTPFFEQKFGVLMSNQLLAQYNEEERRKLYVDFLSNVREMPMGQCLRHYSEGECKHMANMVNCASCSRLCTGKKYLFRWKILLENQKKRIQELEQIYKDNNIEENVFSNFVEYLKEMKILNSYLAVVEKIEGGIDDGDIHKEAN